MAEVPEFNTMPMDFYSEEEFYADYQCDVKNKGETNHLSWKSCNSDWSTCKADPLREIRKPKKCSHAFKKAVMIVVIVEKLKRGNGLESHCFFDDFDLLNGILVEEKVFAKDVESTCAVQPKFRFSYSEVFMISDNRGKCLALREYDGKAHLLALFLQNGNIANKANIDMGFHISAPSIIGKDPVTLGIKGRDLYLTCVAEGDNRVLCLTQVSNMQKKRDNDLLPFLFYKRQNGSSHTFESVAFSGWYINTTQADNQFVQMKPEEDRQHIREFMLEKSQ